MYTLKDTMLPPEDHLRNYIDAEVPDTDDETVIQQCIEGIARNLVQDPRMYRSYGAFWPAVKQLIIERVPTGDAGENVDHDIAAVYSYDNPVYTLAAATLYHSHRISGGFQYATQHHLPVDDYETYEFHYSDEEMERRILK